jgi:hypothetical protein
MNEKGTTRRGVGSDREPNRWAQHPAFLFSPPGSFGDFPQGGA